MSMDAEIKRRAEIIFKYTDGKICKHCLGRKFSDILNGPNNIKRGEEVINKLKDEIKFDDAECNICGHIFQKIEPASIRAKEKLEYMDIEYHNFLIGTKIDKNILSDDEELTEKVGIDVENIKKELNRELGLILEDSLGVEVDFDNPEIIINVNYKPEKPTIYLMFNPIFIEGRYRKLIRGIPQTKWPCGKCKGKGCEACNFTGKQYPETVEEFISEPALEMCRGRDAKFHGAGREDIDVRMLGEGRPFVLELRSPKTRTIDLEELENRVNKGSEGKVEVQGLKYTHRKRKAEIKVSSPDTYKVYRAEVELDDDIEEDDLVKLNNLDIIEQRTPNRVSHRRADKIRERKVFNIESEFIDSKHIILTIKGQGGLYIKELISSDEGRSNPSISSVLGVGALCTQLDVIEVGK